VRRLLVWLALTLIAALSQEPGVAHAEERPPPPPKRKKPDYDGRGGAPKTPGQKALLVPRVILFPAYVVSEYLIRRPLAAGITYAERAGWPAWVSDFLALDQTHPVGVVPFMLIDFGFQPSAGLYWFWDDAGFKGHQLRLRGSTWGPHWLSATATERFLLGQQEVTFTATATKRPDYAFYGIGPDTREAARRRYGADTLYARAESRLKFRSRSLFETSIGYRGARFKHSDYEDLSLDDAIADGSMPVPPGYRDGYRAPFVSARLMLDSRRSAYTRTGGRVDLAVEPSVDLANAPSSGWLRYSGTLWGFVDLNQAGRVVSVSVTATLVDPIGDRPVPFTQLASLGGGRSMPGLRTGRLADRSSAVAMLRYSWPIWLSLNGSLQAGLGNVFGEHFSGFRPGRARVSTAIGLETSSSRDSVFQAIVSFGTETLESGADVDTIRVAVGVRSGF
jgi:hypothetical protein